MTTATPPIDPETITFEDLAVDPYPTFARLRESSPIVHVPAFDEWYVTRWDDCMEISAMSEAVQPGRDLDDEFFGAPNILTLDGSDHKALREGIDARLRPRVVKTYVEDEARPLIVDYIERIRDRGSADLTTELFELISVRVIGNQLGMTDLDDDTLIRWFHVLSASHNIRDGSESGVLAEIETYLRRKIEVLRSAPDHSIMSHMLTGGVAPGAEPRTYEDVSATLRVIILGGFQEPGHAVANALAGLFSRPEQLAELVADPERLAAPALNEGLRWIAPVSAVGRTARQDIKIGDATIPAGGRITLVVASANRDERRFTDPDTYDLHRMLQPHASFGYGEHYCSGHFLGRALGQIVLEETVRRLPGLRPDPDKPAVIEGYGFRAATHLPAVWDR